MNDLYKMKFKPMDVAFSDCLWRPRRLVLEVDPDAKFSNYTSCSETGGVYYNSPSALMTQEEWLVWIDRFSDDLTGRELREAKQAAVASFEEPKDWQDFRRRFKETGSPWLHR